MNKDLSRYSRQIFFPGIGQEGQEKLVASRVVVMGCGALGTVVASSLARAGIGHLKIVDRDFIEESNLQRQILFDEEDIRQGLPKAEAARRKLEKVNSTITVESVVADIGHDNVESLIEGADLVIDAMDNFETRFLLNDACVKHTIPWIYGACIASAGMTFPILPGTTPCLKCVYESAPPPELSPSCDTAGVLNSVVNIVASLQVTSAYKILVGRLDTLVKDMIYLDAWEGTFRRLHVGDAPREDCPCCVEHRFDSLTAKVGSQITTFCGRDAVQISQRDPEPLDFAHMAAKLKNMGEVKHNAFMLQFKIDDFTFTVFPDRRAIIQGTRDPVAARNLYAKYVGV